MFQKYWLLWVGLLLCCIYASLIVTVDRDMYLETLQENRMVSLNKNKTVHLEWAEINGRKQYGSTELEAGDKVRIVADENTREYIIDDKYGNRGTIQSSVLEGNTKNVLKRNGWFRHNTTIDNLNNMIGKHINEFVKQYGDYTYASVSNHCYEFPHIVGWDAERHEILYVQCNDNGQIKSYSFGNKSFAFPFAEFIAPLNLTCIYSINHNYHFKFLGIRWFVPLFLSLLLPVGLLFIISFFNNFESKKHIRKYASYMLIILVPIFCVFFISLTSNDYGKTMIPIIIYVVVLSYFSCSLLFQLEMETTTYRRPYTSYSSSNYDYGDYDVDYSSSSSSSSGGGGGCRCGSLSSVERYRRRCEREEERKREREKTRCFTGRNCYYFEYFGRCGHGSDEKLCKFTNRQVNEFLCPGFLYDESKR